MNKQDIRIAIVKSEFNAEIVQGMLEGAKKAALEEGFNFDQIDIFSVPGAFELPLIAKKLAKTNQYQAIVCLGAVIEGETAHFDFVSMGVTMGITQASLETELPILFGVLTCNLEQAYVRSEGDINKGYHTFKAAMSMIDTCNEIEQMSENLLH